MAELDGTTVAVLATDGFEDSELIDPWKALEARGARLVLVSLEPGTISGEKGHPATVDRVASEVSPDEFDALLLPGGVQNGDDLRQNSDAVELVRSLAAADKPIGVICHGGWILTDADVVRGRTMTSFPSLRTDLTNAGATWVDEEVVVDRRLVSSRNPHDLPAFCRALVEVVGGKG